MTHTDLFRRFWWLPSAHLETILSAYNKTPVVEYTRRIINTTENDEIALDYIIGDAKKPLLVIFHGLEGCSHSRAIRLLAAGFRANGWTIAVPHFRSCGGHMNRFPRAYHAADVKDIAWMLKYCQAGFPHTTMFAAGISLGGTALLHYLADAPQTAVAAAVTVSAPFDLSACVKAIDSGVWRRLYARHFLKSLRAKIIQKSERYPSICDLKKLKSARTLGAFDELYTAPVHGFASAAAYWQKASVTDEVLKRITRPLLCVNALNDPLIAKKTLPQLAPAGTVFCRPKYGGHGGFFGNPTDWLFETTYQFLFSQENT